MDSLFLFQFACFIFMLINAFNHANDAQRAELQKWVDAKNFDRKEKVAAVTRLYNEIGIDKLAQDKIAYYFEQAPTVIPVKAKRSG